MAGGANARLLAFETFMVNVIWWSKNEKSKNGLFMPTWNLCNSNGFQVYVHGVLWEKSPDRYNIFKLFNFCWFQSKGLKQVKALQEYCNWRKEASFRL